MFGLYHGFMVCTGERYLGTFIKDDKFKRDRLKEHMDMWENNIHRISDTTGKCPHKLYYVVVSAAQLEWIFLQLIIKIQKMHLQ